MTHRPCKKRRSGFAVILVAGAWLALCGIAALSFDLSRLYARKAEAQKAADAAALAGSYGEGTSPGEGWRTARQYAAGNGYDVAAGATINAAPDSKGLYRVTLKRPEPVYFARLSIGPEPMSVRQRRQNSQKKPTFPCKIMASRMGRFLFRCLGLMLTNTTAIRIV